ncbi:hypothetical protein LY76DRAFT_597496, partial [Colletotrichum caudatum]
MVQVARRLVPREIARLPQVVVILQEDQQHTHPDAAKASRRRIFRPEHGPSQPTARRPGHAAHIPGSLSSGDVPILHILRS